MKHIEEDSKRFLEAFNNVDDRFNNFVEAWDALFDYVKSQYEPEQDRKDEEVEF